MACEDLQNEFDAAVQKSLDLQTQLQDPTLKDPQEIAALRKALSLAGAAQIAAAQALAACKLQNGLVPPPPRTPAASARILQTDFANPPFAPSDPNWNQGFRQSITLNAVGTFTGFPYFGKEWAQVLAPDDEYDAPATLVGASGWVVNPNYAGGDFPFDHPWSEDNAEHNGFDFEFELLTDAQYQGLLGPGNKGDPTGGSDLYGEWENENLANALQLDPADGSVDTSKGLLGIEWEAHNMPQSFRDNVHPGDRTVVAGRWIVDCGHPIARTEIHPPLLLACGSAPDPATTKVIFTSRPYLVGQTYTTDFPSIYVDGKNDDGEFMTHILIELAKANATLFGIPLASVHIEAHPKIKSRPFSGNPQLRFTIRPSLLPVVGDLAVSYQFTIRSGITVQITNPEVDRVDVLITMTEDSYQPPPLPHCNHQDNYTPEQLDGLNSDVGSAFLDAEVLSSLLQGLSVIAAPVVDKIISSGIYTDHYDPLDNIANVLDSSQQATNTFGSNTAGVVLDDSQPFPIFGWLEVQWIPYAGYVRIRNGWQGDHCINVESGAPVSSPIQLDWWSADWVFVVQPYGEYWIQNRWTGGYLNIEPGTLQSSAIQADWWSARWAFIPVPGTNQFQIRNVWRPLYLNIEGGALVAGPIQPDWWSGRWNVEKV